MFTGPPISTDIIPPIIRPTMIRELVSIPFRVSISHSLMPATGGVITNCIRRPIRKIPNTGKISTGLIPSREAGRQLKALRRRITI